MSKRGLGKGLNALIPDPVPGERDLVVEVELAKLSANPAQPRQVFEPEKLAELADSIREHGLLQPVLVTAIAKGYQIVAGERRWRAAQLAGLERIPVIVRNLSPREAAEIALIENLQREDLNPIEEAAAYRRLITEHKLTQDDLARRLGCSRPHITNTLRLLQLPAAVQGQVATGQVSPGHAKVLLGIGSPARVTSLAQQVAAGGLSVRALETLVQKEGERAPKRAAEQRSARELSPELAAVEDRLREKFGTPVKVLPGTGRGRIEIHFFGQPDLERVVDLLLGGQTGGGVEPERLQPKVPFSI